MTENNIARETCPRCAVKHIGQACVLMKEVRKGYPHHVWYALAHLAEAEDEIIDMMPDEANAVRDERIRIERSLKETGDCTCAYVPDFEALMYLVAQGGMLEEVL